MDWSIILLALVYLGILVGLTWWLQRYHCSRSPLESAETTVEPKSSVEPPLEDYLDCEEFFEDTDEESVANEISQAQDSTQDSAQNPTQEVFVKIAVPDVDNQLES